MAVKASKDIKRTLPQPALEAALKGSGLGVRESLIEDTIDEMRVQLPMCSGLGIGLGLGLGIGIGLGSGLGLGLELGLGLGLGSRLGVRRLDHRNRSDHSPLYLHISPYISHISPYISHISRPSR